MIQLSSAQTTKKLVLQFIKENIDYSKACSSLQEIIRMGKINDVWQQALSAYFGSHVDNFPHKKVCKN